MKNILLVTALFTIVLLYSNSILSEENSSLKKELTDIKSKKVTGIGGVFFKSKDPKMLNE